MGAVRIDLNADVGEGAGAERELLELVSSASVACGGHAGDEDSMRDTVIRAVERGVAIGAHPSYADRHGFGRRELGTPPAQIEEEVARQIELLLNVCDRAGALVSYVKPHGALYNRAMRDRSAAEAIVRAIERIDTDLVVLGMHDSALLDEAHDAGFRTAREAFLDRAYAADGNLLSRADKRAMLDNVDAAAERAVRLAREGTLVTADDTTIPLPADSLCVHGDGPQAVEIARAARARLEETGIGIVSFV